MNSGDLIPIPLLWEISFREDEMKLHLNQRPLFVVKPHGGHKHCHWLDVKDTIRVLEED